MCKKHKRVSVMATETPIETLRQALDVAAWPRSPEAYKAYTDARAALEDVEALRVALDRAQRVIHSIGKHQLSPVGCMQGECFALTPALVKFQVES